jgi:hypothetical protein
MPAMLTQEQRLQYARDGYIVLPGFKQPDEISRLRQRAAEIVDAFDPDESRSVFTTREQRADDRLGSDNTIRCFFEEEAFDEHGQLRQAKALSINKIGHAMHELDPVFERFTRDAGLAEVARSRSRTGAGVAVDVALLATKAARSARTTSFSRLPSMKASRLTRSPVPTAPSMKPW